VHSSFSIHVPSPHLFPDSRFSPPARGPQTFQFLAFPKRFGSSFPEVCASRQLFTPFFSFIAWSLRPPCKAATLKPPLRPLKGMRSYFILLFSPLQTPFFRRFPLIAYLVLIFPSKQCQTCVMPLFSWPSGKSIFLLLLDETCCVASLVFFSPSWPPYPWSDFLIHPLSIGPLKDVPLSMQPFESFFSFFSEPLLFSPSLLRVVDLSSSCSEKESRRFATVSWN